MNWLRWLFPQPVTPLIHKHPDSRIVHSTLEPHCDLTPSFLLDEDIDSMDFTVLTPILFLIFADANLWCDREKLPLRVTNIVNERIEGISVSDTHAEGRAIDISIQHWSPEDISKFVKHFNSKYKSYGTSQSGLPVDNKVAVYHLGTAWHIHLQVKRD